MVALPSFDLRILYDQEAFIVISILLIFGNCFAILNLGGLSFHKHLKYIFYTFPKVSFLGLD